MSATISEEPSSDDIRAHLEKVLASAPFRDAQRSSRLLRFLVEETLAGRAATLKEYTLGADALQRGPDFDPRTDPIARVEASRLRTRMELYYANEGAGDSVVIALRKGSYVPAFERRQPAARAAATPAATRYLVVGAVAGAALALALGLALRDPRVEPVERQRQSMQLEVDVGGDDVIGSEVGVDFALSPDGSELVFVTLEADGSTRLRARRLKELSSRELPGTYGVRAPFMSPDGRWVAFWSEGKLKKTLVDGDGTPVTICDATDLLGGSWGADGYIVAALSNLSLLRIHPDRCEPTAIVAGQAPLRLVWPQALPAGDVALVTAVQGQSSAATIDVLDLKTGARKTVIRGGTYGRYLPSGHLLYVNSGTLFAVAFDLERLETSGAPTAILDDVSYSPVFGYAQFDFSSDGTLAYRRATAGGSVPRWLDADGTARTLLDSSGRYQWLRLSPDGRRVAFTLQESDHYDLWTYDVQSDRRTRLSRGVRDQSSPVWTPDAQFILTGSQEGIFYVPSGGPAAGQLLVQNGSLAIPWSFAPNGRRLAYYTMSGDTALDLWTVPVEATPAGLRAGTSEPFRVTPAVEVYPSFSPDGRWMAYGSNESGSWEVYVRAFPDDGRQVQVSVHGGRIPAWSPATTALFYETDDHRVMVATYAVEQGKFVPATPRPWTTMQLADTGVIANFDVAADGRSIAALVPAAGAQPPRNRITFVTNFFDEIERRAPARPGD